MDVAIWPDTTADMQAVDTTADMQAVVTEMSAEVMREDVTNTADETFLVAEGARWDTIR